MDKDLYLNFKFNYMSQENQTLSLFSDDQIPAKWEEEWVGMPEFKQQDENSFQSIIVHFPRTLGKPFPGQVSHVFSQCFKKNVELWSNPLEL